MSETAANEPIDIKPLEKSSEPPAVSLTTGLSAGVNDKSYRLNLSLVVLESSESDSHQEGIWCLNIYF